MVWLWEKASTYLGVLLNGEPFIKVEKWGDNYSTSGSYVDNEQFDLATD